MAKGTPSYPHIPSLLTQAARLLACLITILITLQATETPASANSDFNNSVKIEEEDALEFNAWLEWLTADPALEWLDTFDISAGTTEIDVTFNPDFCHSDLGMKINWIGFPDEAEIADNQILITPFLLSFNGFDSYEIAPLAAKIRQSEYPVQLKNASTEFGKITTTPRVENKALSVPKWPMAGWIIALFVVFLFLFWTVRWLYGQSKVPFDWPYLMGLCVSAVYMIHYRLINISECPKLGNFSICGDSVRDWAGAITVSQGLTFPLIGPAIHGEKLFMGPYYHMALGAGAYIWNDPSVFYIIELLFSWFALFIAASFVRRSFGGIHSFFFVIIALSIEFLGEGSCRIIHDYLPLPFSAIYLWVLWDMWQTRSGRHLPLAVLSLSLAIQFYATHIYGFIPLVFLLLFGRVRIRLRDALVSAGVFILVHSFTLINAMMDRPSMEDSLPGETFTVLQYIQDVFAQLIPFESISVDIRTGISLLIIILFLFLLLRPSSRRELLKAKAIVFLFFLAAFIPFLFYHSIWAGRWAAVFFPAAPIMTGVVVGSIANHLVSRFKLAGFIIAALTLAIIIQYRSDHLTPREITTAAPWSISHTKSILAELEELNIHSPADYQDTFHSWYQPPYLLNLFLYSPEISHALSPQAPPHRNIWLTNTPLPELEPGTFVQNSNFNLAYVAYESHIDTDHMKVSGAIDFASGELTEIFDTCYTWPIEVITGDKRPHWLKQYYTDQNLEGILHFSIPVREHSQRTLLVLISNPFSKVKILNAPHPMFSRCKKSPSGIHQVCMIPAGANGYEFDVTMDKKIEKFYDSKRIDFFDPPIVDAEELFNLFQQYENDASLDQSSRDN